MKPGLFAPLLLFLLFPVSFSQVTSEGGNVTDLNLSGIDLSHNWDGLYGEVVLGTGTNSTHNVTGNVIIELNITAQDPNCTISNQTMHIIAANASSISLPLSSGNLAILDAMIDGSENGSNVFTATSSFVLSYGTINSVPTAYTNAGGVPSADFREGYLNDASGNLVFVTEVVNNRPNWMGGTSDYQMMLPNDGSHMQYYIWADVVYTCANLTPPDDDDDKKHDIFILPVAPYEVEIGGTFEGDFTVKNKGDFTEWNIDVTLDCPAGFACGSGFLPKLLKNADGTVSIPITADGVGTYTITVCAQSDDDKFCRDFIVEVVPECTIDKECLDEEYCSEYICNPKKELEEECDRDGECLSGLCNGMCILCESDADCASDKMCSGGYCIDVECPCGFVSSHSCNAYACCADTDCGECELCMGNTCNPIELDILVIGGEMMEGESVQVQILDNNGQGVSGAEVFTNEMASYSDANGYASIIAPYDGMVYASTDCFQAGLILDITKKGFFVLESEIFAGVPTVIQLVDSRGLPIPFATVYIGDDVLMTDGSGRITYTFQYPGKVLSRGQKPGYNLEDAEVDVFSRFACGYPITVNLFWFNADSIIYLWLWSAILATLNFALIRNRMKKWENWKKLLYGYGPLILGLPGIWLLTICFVSNVITIQFIAEAALFLRRIHKGPGEEAEEALGLGSGKPKTFGSKADKK